MDTIRNLSIKKFSAGLRAKEFSALEVTQAFFADIKKHDGDIHAYLSLNEEGALRDAEAVDIALAKGEEPGLLAGVPVALKDNMLVKGLPATAASKILEQYIASYDGGAVKKIKEAGAVILGKTNLDEFAFGSSTENSAFGPTKNPHDLERVPGGSSGGSAAAVAGHLALGAYGSDTGGSIRQPSAFCGVVGLKPTYGAVSRSGLIAMASSLDQIGPIAKTVEDAALLFFATAGKDPLDATSADYPDEWKHIPTLPDIQHLTVGIPKEFFIEGLDPEIEKGVRSAAEALKSLGIQFKDISLPHTKYALSCYYVVMPAEVSANLARFDGVRYAQIPHTAKDPFAQRGAGFGTEAKRRVILGTFVLSSGYHDAYYKKAQEVRALIARDYENAFKEVDAVLAPTTPTIPFKIGERAADPLAMYLSDIFTIPANLAGIPALSIPVRNYTHSSGLPIGFQLIGKHFREQDILGLGHHYERIT